MKTRCLVLATLLVGLLAPAAQASPPLDDLLLPLTPFRAPRAETTAKPLAFDDADDGEAIVQVQGWIDDDHFLLLKEGRLLTVQASTGKQAVFRGMNPFGQQYSRPGPGAWPQKGKNMGSSVTSPDKKWDLLVRNGNLFIKNKAANTEMQLTKDGSDVILNGKADWVYWEELFHRNSSPTAWWSPDSTCLAFLRLDDTEVPRFTILDNTQRQQTPELTRYPKVGAPNPTVKLGIAKAADGSVTWADLSDYPKDILICRVGWLPDSKAPYFFVQDRIQTWLDVCTVPLEGGKPTKLFRDRTEAWIEDLGPLKFLKNGSFLHFSDRTGYKHIYHRGADGKLKEQITTGPWEVRSIDKIDEEGGWLFFTRSTNDFLDSQAYRVKLDGTRMEPLTKDSGTHEVLFSPSGAYFTDTFSTIDTAPQVALRKGDGSLVRVVEQPPKEKAQGNREFVQIKTSDGFVMNGMVYLPPNVDKSKKYPVWFKTYAGPGAPEVRNASGGKGGNAESAATSQGYIVFHADPRSASGKGSVSSWACYKQLGVQETKDIATAIQWLLDTYPFADGQRVGMSGTSYGGYITAYCMTHTKLFAAGIAGAPVTDWRNYDSIYTERYMGLPDENAKGYDAGSVVKAAKNLHGRLLLVHGMKDDNVHMQNSVELMDALQKANLSFEVMFYPHARHGGFGKHYQTLSNDFMKRTLQPGS
jgi:dipeptidyl-peptidase 4